MLPCYIPHYLYFISAYMNTVKKILITILLFFVIAGASIFAYGTYLENKSPEISEMRIHEAKGIKEMIGNITILELPIKMTPYEKGLQYGELLQPEIHEVIETLDTEVLGKYGNKKFLVKTVLLQKAFTLEKHILEQYIQEMKGISSGAQVKYSDILLINTYDDLLYLAGCSSISGNIHAQNKEFFHARNLDYPIPELAGKTVIVNDKDEQVIRIGFPGYIGALTATNTKTGISLSSHTSRSKNSQEGIPTGFLYREIIKNAQNLADAKNILENSERTIGNNLLVSSLPENTSSVFEFDALQVVERNAKNSNFSFATNHFVSKKFLNNMSENSQKRYSYLQNFSLNTPEISLQSIQNIMSDYDGSTKGWSSLANFGTVQSVIIFPKSQKIFLANGKNSPVTGVGYVEYEY